MLFDPVASREDGDGHGDAEESLRYGGMRTRDGSGQEKQNGEAAEDALRDYCGERG